MLLHLLSSLTHFTLLANALTTEHITFNSHRELLQDSSTDDPRFSPSSVYPIPHTAATLRTRPTTVYRPRSLHALRDARTRSLRYQESPIDPLEWNIKQVPGPDIEDRHTLAQLARMSGNAYALPGWPRWYEVDQPWNQSFPFGWEDAADGFRGHVFLSADNSTVVLSIKGTTLNGPTSQKDRFNDNLLFSCCCGHVTPPWLVRQVCKCYSGRLQCDSACLSKALIDDSLFYSIGVHLVDNLIAIYPDANIWLTGHSLGGSLASLLAATYGFPAVTFEAPGERLAATRLYLPLPPSPPPPPPPPPSSSSSSPLPLSILSSSSNTDNNPHHHHHHHHHHPAHPHLPITHVYHTSDPIPQGACTGFFSPCTQGGFALETKCHLGKSIVFDTVGKLGWFVDVRTHVIKVVISRLLEDEEIDWSEPDDEGDDDDDDDDDDEGWWDWFKRMLRLRRRKKSFFADGRKEPEKKKKRDVPAAVVEEDCVDCFKWKFGDFKDPGDDDGGGDDDDDDDDDDDIPEPPDQD